MTAAELQKHYNLPSVRFYEDKGGFIFIEVKTPLAEALLTTHGGHIMRFTPAGEKPLLWMSEYSNFSEGKAIRGGIPVCWPWFGAHPTDAGKPAHGFARLSEWELDSAGESADGTVHISMRLDSEHVSCGCGKPFALVITFTIGKTLTTSLTMWNNSDQPVEISTALHTYFSVGDIEKTTVSGLDGCLYDSRVVGAEESGLRQQGDVGFGMEVDRVYFNDGTVVIHDTAQNRRIRVEKSGSRTTVVWNPWIAKSRKMADFGDEEYHSMLCIEAANLLSDTITLPPHSEHSLSQTIGVE